MSEAGNNDKPPDDKNYYEQSSSISAIGSARRALSRSPKPDRLNSAGNPNCRRKIPVKASIKPA